MPSLGFDLLDRHVVHGRGDDVACSDATGTLSFAQLLERSPRWRAGSGRIGVGAGDEVAVRVGPGNLRVQVVCACVRLGAVPGERGDVRIVEDAAGARCTRSTTSSTCPSSCEVGKTDPAPSLAVRPAGLPRRVSDAFGDVIEALS